MATYYGNIVTNMDAQPFTRNAPHLYGGTLKHVRDVFELADTANNESAIVLPIPVDAIVPSIKAAFDDLGTAGTVDITWFKKNADGTYTELADGLIANGIDVNAAAVALTEYRYSVPNIDTGLKRAWELAGLSARPDYGTLYIGLTTDTGTTTAGTVLLEATYV